MISSVTTVVSTIISSSSVTGLGAALGVVGVITLIVCLVVKELSTGQKAGFGMLGRNLEITVVPLLLVFLSIVGTKILSILS